MPTNKPLLTASILLFLLLGGAFIVKGLQLGKELNAVSLIASSDVRTSGIYADGWIEDGAKIEFLNAAKIGNILELKVDEWRPPGMAPALMTVSVCGRIVAEFEVKSGENPFTIPFSGACRPLKAVFEVKNPFTPGEGDGRKLAVKLKWVKLTSKAGLPVASLRSLTELGNPEYLFLLFLSVIAGAALSSSAPPERARPGSAAYYTLAAFLVFVGALALRFYNLDFGLPHTYHPDEVPKVNVVMRMRQEGSFNPHYFLHPTLLLYLTYFMQFALQELGFEGAGSFFLAGRTVSALAGSLSVLLTFFIAREYFSEKSALTASALLAVFPIHVTCSRYLKEDALLVFLTLLTLYFVLVGARSGRVRYIFIAAFTAGLSASTKYSGALSVFIIIGAPWLRSKEFLPDKRFLKAVVLSGFVCAAGFLIATPYSVLDYTKFLSDLGYESRHMKKGHTTAVDAWSQLWMYHLSRSIAGGVTFLPALLSLLGIGLFIKRRRVGDLFFIALLLLFYCSSEYVVSKPAPQPERYILPCIPLVAIFGAQFIEVIAAMLSRDKWTYFAFSALVCFFPLKRTLNLTSELKPDTREIMAEWIEGNIPENSKIMIDRAAYSVALDKDRYQILILSGSAILEELEVRRLKTSGYDYLILSSLFYDRYFSEPNVEPPLRERIRDVFRSFEIVKEVRPKFGTYGFHNPQLSLIDLKSAD